MACAFVTGALLVLVVSTEARVPQQGRTGIVRAWLAERARGNVETALAPLGDGTWFIDGACAVSTPCRGPAAVRPALERQGAERTADTIVYARAFGSIVAGRLERRSGALRTAGVERAVYGFIAQVPGDKILGWAVLPDLADAETVRAELGSAARPVSALGDRVSVDRRFGDAVTRGDIEAAVNMFTDDGLFLTPAGCLPSPCGRDAIRGRLRGNFSNHAVYTFTNAQTIGSVVLARFELRGDNFRAKGVERVVNIYIAQVPRVHIAAWIQFPDLADPDTLKFFGPY
jgi:hypothetical protein